jgi:CubicO group peptidase (beta-lactamase class C family)
MRGSGKSYGIILLVIALCETAQSLPLVSDSRLQRLFIDIEAVRTDYAVPAVGIALVGAEETLWAGAWGIADLNSKRPAGDDTLFRIGSITKAFTSLAVLILEEQGRLHLDDEVKWLAPDIPVENRWKADHPVRLSHLLEHTAGILDLSKAAFDHSDPGPLTLEEGLAFEVEQRFTHWPPGMHSSYSNVGAGLAAYILESTIDRRYEDFVRQHLFAPLSMSTAGFFLDDRTADNLATGYDTDGRTVIPYWHMILRPFGGINARPRDMAPFLQLLINKGRYRGRRLLEEDSIERMEIPKTTLAAGSGLSYGYGLGNYQYLREGILFHGHGGDGDGYLSHYAYNRDTGLGYFVIINAFKHDALRAIRAFIEGHIIEGMERLKPPRAKVSEQNLRRYTGAYSEVTWRFPWHKNKNIMHIIFKEGALYLRRHSGEERELIPVNGRHFRFDDETIATMAFIKDDAGEVYLQGDTGNFKRVDGLQE